MSQVGVLCSVKDFEKNCSDKMYFFNLLELVVEPVEAILAFRRLCWNACLYNDNFTQQFGRQVSQPMIDIEGGHVAESLSFPICCTELQWVELRVTFLQRERDGDPSWGKKIPHSKLQASN